MNCKILSIFFLVIALVNCNPLSDELRKKRANNDDAVVIVDTPSKDVRTSGFPFRFAFEDYDQDSDSDETFLRPIGFRPFSNFGNSEFGNFWKRFEDMMNEMRKRVYGTVDTGLEDLPPNYHNSTYETKNVNGSIITVNQTIDKQTNNNSHSFFHIKVVQVKPDKPVEETPGTSKTPETPDTEIPKVIPETPETEIPKVVPEVVPEVVPAETSEKTTPEKTNNTPPEVANKDAAPPMEDNEP